MKHGQTQIDEAWDSGDLGRSPEHVVVATPAECREVDESLGLQLISIRLQKALIANLKMVAEYHKIAYQPMIRDLLNRFVLSEMKQIACELSKQLESDQANSEGSGPVNSFLERERKRA